MINLDRVARLLEDLADWTARVTAYPDSLPSRELLIAAARDTAALIRSQLAEEEHRRVLSLSNEGLTLSDAGSPEIGQGAEA